MGARRKSVLFTTVLLACINCSYGCAVTGAITPTLFLTSFRDVDRGTIIDTGTTNIIGMQTPNYGVDPGGTPYIVITFENNRVVVVTNHNYGDYEKYETATFISADVTFTCAPGSPQTSLTVTFRIDVVDTNNNAPEFIPSSGVVYTISTPVPPYYEITGCGNEIVVRDIDLTTNAVHFTVDNPDFEIQSVVPTERPKEFKAMLRTTTLIRSIPEDIILRITATDEDLTGDPPLTTETMITIAGNRDFLMPDELGFSQTFYQHNYDINNNAIVPSQPIVLESGFDDKVDIFLYGGLSNHFKLDTNGNTATLRLETALPDSVFSNQYIFFEVRAEREDTIGTAATIIIQLPEARELMFEESSYRGSIQNNDIALGNIRLAVGYDEKVKFDLHGEFSTHFTLNDEKNGQVTLNVNPTIPENVILENNLIYLTVTASGVNAITTTTSILLDIIKADHTTPVFSRNIYYGTYLGNTIDIQNINLIQGFDKDVKFRLDGEYSNYFQISGEDNDMQLTLRPENIPEDVIFNEKVLVFNVLAEKALTVGAHAVIVIRFPPDLTNTAIMSFSQNTYLGKYENNELEVDQVVLTSGYAPGTEFIITGEYETYFQRSVEENTVSLALDKTLPTDTIPDPFIVLEIEARRERAASVWTSVIINIVEQEIVHPVFTNAYYVGIYNADTEVLQFDEIISLFSGFDDTVTFHLEGEHSDLFRLVPGSDTNSYKIDTKESLPKDLLLDRGHIILTVLARKPGANAAHSTIVIEIKKESLQSPIIRFERVSYVGSIENNLVNLVPIRLTEGYTDDVQFALYGALSEYFTIPNDGPVINLQLPTPIPADLIPASGTIVLDIRASLPETATTFATIVLDVITENDENPAVQLGFDAVYYTGSYGTSGLSMDSRIVLSEGFEEGVHFSLEGADAQWFRVVPTQNVATLVVQSGIPEAVLVSNQQLVFTIKAERLGSTTAQAVVVISLPDENLEISTIGFERVSYVGSIENNVVNLVPITLTEGYTNDVQLALYGALSEYFTIPNDGPVINLQLPTPIPTDLIPASGTIVLDIRASLPETATTFATIVLNVITENDENPAVQLGFDAVYYTGSYGTTGLSMDSRIVLSEGFEEGVHFSLEGADAQWFRVVPTQNVATLVVQSSIPEVVLVSNHQLVFTIKAERPGSITARAAIVISLPDGSQSGENLTFEKVLYRGSIQDGQVDHEDIIVSGFDGTTVTIIGEHSGLFEATATNGMVTVKAQGSLNLPAEITRVDLELRAATARAVLLLNVGETDPVPAPPPTVTFTSDSYAVSVEIVQTGIIGRVLATSDNEEPITYSLSDLNAHLQSRLSINNEGELFLSAPANSGVYTFRVIATTDTTEATATATVHLTVQAITTCGDEIVVPPLITLDRDEEEPHNKLVVLQPTLHAGCHFTLNSLYPSDQDWLFVDDNGLHARVIDREHPSIAFMTLSQVQVELILHCESDNNIRTKRSERTDWFSEIDYGTKNWILTDSIPYNSRRSLVNLIVNDINDNDPIFVGKEHEPIAVGYPIDELEERILPRSLAELKATDADIGWNAKLRYWSSESVLAVAPTTGFVHVQSSASLVNNQILTVHATDRNGEGNSGSIQLVVKLLTANNIAVVTVRNAFLDQEASILERLSAAVGYDVKTLRSEVISEDADPGRQDSGASLQLYVYGLISREPVAVELLVENINSNSEIVNVISTVSLEDHLEDIIVIQRNNGLLASTIALSILLFILMVLIAVWYYLRWRKNKSYDQFSDKNSIASRNESLGDLSKPAEIPPVPLQPRLNIDDLKKSERRLQEMLDAPIEAVTVEPVPSRSEPTAPPLEAILDISMPEINVPIVIQSIDKLKDAEESDDEFGEVGEVSKTPRKSVVTFNENVEKIIHVEDDTDNSSQSGYEIYKF